LLDWIVKNYFGFSHLLPESENQVSLHYLLPSPFQSSFWVYLLFVLVGLGLIWFVYRMNASQLSTYKKVIFFFLRTCSFLLLVVFLIRLSLKIDQIDKPGLVILIDQSKSMAFRDDYGAKYKSIKIKDEKKTRYPSRIEMVQSVLSNQSNGLLGELTDRYHVYLYQFSEKPVPLLPADSNETHSPEEIANSLLQIKPEGENTLIASSVRSVLREFRGRPPAALVVFSDGVSSSGYSEQLSEVAEESFGQYVPIYPIGVGSDKALRDINIVHLDAEDVAYVNNPVRFSALIRSNGYKKKSVTVQLKSIKSAQVFDEKEILLTEEDSIATVDLYYESDKTGSEEFIVNLKGVEDELVQQNNQLTRTVEFKEEDLKVLLIEGYPRWEFRALKDLLEREQSITLKTLLQDADLEYSRADKTALNHLPVKLTELLKFDVVIMGDIDVTAFSTRDIQNLTDYVVKGHGGLFMIAGDVYTPSAWTKTPFLSVLPFQKNIQPDLSKEMNIELTDAGKNQFKFFQFSEESQQNEEIWNKFPPIHWLYHSDNLKPGVIPLVQTSPDEGLKPQPVITFHRIGNGKVLFHFTDELWRWRFRTGDLYSGKYWGKVIRFLSRSRIRGTSHLAELLVDQESVNQGESVGFLLRYYDGSVIDIGENEMNLQIISSDGEMEEVTLHQNELKKIEFRANWIARETGTFHIVVESPSNENGMPETDIIVKNVDQELLKRSLNRDDLKKASETSKGKYFHITDVANLPGNLPAGSPVVLDSPTMIPLWNRWELLLFFSILLSVEWIMRKQNKLD
jgi:von Willebrand factor type A domain